MKLISKRTNVKLVRAMERFIDGGAEKFLMYCFAVFGGLTLLRLLFSPVWPIVVAMGLVAFLLYTSKPE